MLGVGGPRMWPGRAGIFSNLVELLDIPPVLSVMSSLSMLPLRSEKLNGRLLYPAMSVCKMSQLSPKVSRPGYCAKSELQVAQPR